jgi:Phospholipase_D-nuclease N-terminal
LLAGEKGKAVVIGWSAVVLLVPFLGVILYYLLGRSQIPGWQRLTLALGGLLAYMIILGVGAVIGGVV